MSGTDLAQGSRSNGGGNGSITSLKEPIGLRKVSNMLEPDRKSGVDHITVLPVKIFSFASG